MQNLEPANPLMSPVQWNGQTYFTSHYFHQQYRANKPEGGKYSRQGDFMRLIRNIETYPKYIERNDIVELEYKSLKGQTDADFASVKSCFEQNSFNPIMLINATAQVALTHHLDDEISKQASVGVNEQAAKRVKAKAMKLGEVADFYMGLAHHAMSLFGLSNAIAFAGALSGIEDATGMPTGSIRTLLPGAAPADIGRLNATELGQKLGLSARAVNKALSELGLQEKHDDEWRLTAQGEAHGEMIPFVRNGHAGYQILWKTPVIGLLEGGDAHE